MSEGKITNYKLYMEEIRQASGQRLGHILDVILSSVHPLAFLYLYTYSRFSRLENNRYASSIVQNISLPFDVVGIPWPYDVCRRVEIFRWGGMCHVLRFAAPSTTVQ